MAESDWLADRFEENRVRLGAVAHRMLGSASDADDAVQESWLRLQRSDTSEVENLPGWLTTVVDRVCLDILRWRRSRREESLEIPGDTGDNVLEIPEPAAGPEREALLADSVGLAMLVVLETLTPAERLAFVLHDMFAVPSTRSPRSSAAPPTLPRCWRAAPGGGCSPRPFPTRTGRVTGRSSRRSSPPHAR
jgi:DNA-directed RNA polymerase specialized sigma24 family protein